MPQTLLSRVKRVEIDTGKRAGVTTSEARRVKDLERENRELRRANEILKLASTFFAQVELDRRIKASGTSAAHIGIPSGNRQFKADRLNQLWVSDFTCVSTWRAALYVAFVIDVLARRIVGWRISRSMTTDFVLDACGQARYASQTETAN